MKVNRLQGKDLDPDQIEEINIFVLSKVRDIVFGEHSSVFYGSGFDFSGLREWQPGDRPVNIDWAHSTHTGFSPLVVREFVEERSINIFIVADRSLSTRCGIDGMRLDNIISRIIATIGFSAVAFQDKVGLIAFGEGNNLIESPKGGKNQIFFLLDSYKNKKEKRNQKQEKLVDIISANLIRTSLVVLVSDFLFSDAKKFIKELSELKSIHDIFLVMIDSSFVFSLPDVDVGWIEGIDVETGSRTLLSREEFRKMERKTKLYQDELRQYINKEGFETLVLNKDPVIFQNAVIDFFLERRLRKK